MKDNSTSNRPNSGTIPGNGASAISHAAASAHTAIDEAARMAQPAIDRVVELAHEATEKAGSAGGQAVNWLDERGEQVAATQKKLVEGTCDYVSANPLKSIGMALLAGFLVSRIVR